MKRGRVEDLSFKQIFKRGFRGIDSVQGRDTRPQFWLYVAMVFGPLLVAKMAAPFILMPLKEFLTVDIWGKPAAENARFLELMGTGSVNVAYFQLVLYFFGSLLLLAAASRRLHDRDRSGWWALTIPLAALAIGLDGLRQARLYPEMMARFIDEARKLKPQGSFSDVFSGPLQSPRTMMEPSWFAIIAAMAILSLSIELMRAGTDGRNRFGSAPE